MRKSGLSSRAHSALGGAAPQSRGERLAFSAQPVGSSSARSESSARKRPAAATSTPHGSRVARRRLQIARSSSGQKRPRDEGLGVTAGGQNTML